jgi:hypothetical protein
LRPNIHQNNLEILGINYIHPQLESEYSKVEALVPTLYHEVHALRLI